MSVVSKLNFYLGSYILAFMFAHLAKTIWCTGEPLVGFTYYTSFVRNLTYYFFQIIRVYYPGLPSHPEHHIAKRQMTGFGGVVSFEVGSILFCIINILVSLICSRFGKGGWRLEHHEEICWFFKDTLHCAFVWRLWEYSRPTCHHVLLVILHAYIIILW